MRWGHPGVRPVFPDGNGPPAAAFAVVAPDRATEFAYPAPPIAGSE